MAKVIETKNGKSVVLLNPSEKSMKYATELKTGVRMTNDGQIKSDANGEVGLSKNQRAFRAGYLTARSDNAKVYKYKKKQKSSRKKKTV